MVDIALFQPDIPQNLGATMRVCACTGSKLHVIEPCGFPLDSRKIRQAGMDYIDALDWQRYENWHAFIQQNADRRLILMTTKGSLPFTQCEFQSGDILIAGRESAGAPDYVHDHADARVFIPMSNGQRSLNIVNATAMILGEALRQTGHW